MVDGQDGRLVRSAAVAGHSHEPAPTLLRQMAVSLVQAQQLKAAILKLALLSRRLSPSREAHLLCIKVSLRPLPGARQAAQACRDRARGLAALRSVTPACRLIRLPMLRHGILSGMPDTKEHGTVPGQLSGRAGPLLPETVST